MTKCEKCGKAETVSNGYCRLCVTLSMVKTLNRREKDQLLKKLVFEESIPA